MAQQYPASGSQFVMGAQAMSSLQLAAASYIYIYYALKKKRKERRWWQMQLYTNREVSSGSRLLADLNFQSVSGLYKNFTRMSPSEFEFLIHLIGKKISKKDTEFGKATSIQESLALTLRFLASGDSYVSLQYLFKISKQAINGMKSIFIKKKKCAEISMPNNV
jgi:hypothetical protein